MTKSANETPATDELIERLISDTYLLGQALNANGQRLRASYVFNAMADLINARDPEVAKRMDAERLARAKA